MFVESPNVKGAVAEQAIVLAATKLRIPVWRPVAEHGRCDLVLEIAERLWRVQVKWGRLSKAGDVIIVHCCTSRHTPNGYVRTTYSEEEVDLFAVYCGALDRCFLLPASLAAERHAVQLRVMPPRNGQRACINLAEDFEFEGAIAQLGERRRGTAEVAGSSPASSISSPLQVGCDSFRDHFGYWLDQATKGEHLLVTRRGRPVATLSPPLSPPQLPLEDQVSAPAPG
jgi:hypothetical protein